MKIYQVGGAVRDKIMGKKPNDIDYVVVGSSVREMTALGYLQVGKGFPVFLDPVKKEEYALARKEVKVGSKHTDFEFIFNENITLREDLERRDFTCNAIAYDEENDAYIDYFGGRRDIKNKVLRHINDTHFVEDPLRVLRMCRFAAQLDFEVAGSTKELCRNMVNSGMLKYLTAERVWNELHKAMKCPAFHRFIELAREIGVLAAVLPEIDAMWETLECADYHPEGNTGGHTLSALKAAVDSPPLVKFGILTHDLGKILTPKNEQPSHKLHEIHAKDLICQICERFKIPHCFRNFACMAAYRHMQMYHVLAMKPVVLYELAVAMTINHYCYVEEFIAVCRADCNSLLKPDMEKKMKLFETKAAKLRFACQVVNNIKATDLPDFATLPKNKDFKRLLDEYKIGILRKELQKFQI